MIKIKKEIQEEKFDFKFLNRVMYITTFIFLCYVLKNIGVLDKILSGITALTPVLFGIVICWITMPLANKLKKWGFSKNTSAILSLVIILLIIALIVALVIPIFVDQVSNLLKEFPTLYRMAVEKINYLVATKFTFIKDFKINADLQYMDIIKNNISDILDYSINTVQSVVGTAINIGMAIVVAFFMVKDMDKFKSSLIAFLSKNTKNSNRYKMITEIEENVMSYIKGVLIDSFIVGILTTIVCMILKLDYAIVFGLIIMVLNLIPYIGAILSYTLASLYAFTVGGPVLAVITFIALFIVQVIDANILQPNIVSKSVNLHPVVVLAGVVVFQLLFGIFGMIIAVPVIAALKIIIKYQFNLNFEFEDNKKIEDVEVDNKKIKEELSTNKYKYEELFKKIEAENKMNNNKDK